MSLIFKVAHHLPPRIWLINYDSLSVIRYATNIINAIFIIGWPKLKKLENYLSIAQNTHYSILRLITRRKQSFSIQWWHRNAIFLKRCLFGIGYIARLHAER